MVHGAEPGEEMRRLLRRRGEGQIGTRGGRRFVAACIRDDLQVAESVGGERGGLPPPVDAVSLSMLPRHYHVPVVLHRIVRPSREQPRDHGPLVPVHGVCG